MNNEKIINKVNKFLDSKIFEIQAFYGLDLSDKNYNIDIKIKITGQKEMLTMGEWEDYYTYEVTILPSNEIMNMIFSNLFDKESSMEIKSYGNKISIVETISIKSRMVLDNLLDYFSIDQNTILTKLTYKGN